MSDPSVWAGQEPPQTTKPDAPTIADATQACLDRFQSCLDKAALIHPREVSLVEDQLARFSIWAANIKAPGKGRDSLDYRLREAPDVQDIIAGLLEALGAHLERCRKSLDRVLNEEPPEGEKDVLAPVGDDLKQHLQRISTSIGLLHKFSNTIRKASKAAQDTKAGSSFEILDEDGNNVEPFLREIFARYLLDRFPEADEPIQQRLVATMIIRWKRILYRRSRYGKAPKKAPNQGPARPRLGRRMPNTKPQPVIQPDETPSVQTTETPTPDEAPREEEAQEKSVAHTATTLRPEKFQKASSPSVISTSQSVALSGHEELSFPPPPCGALFRSYNKMKKSMQASLRRQGDMSSLDNPSDSSDEPFRYGSNTKMIRARRYVHRSKLRGFWTKSVEALGEVTCPYCFHTISAQEAVDKSKWRNHVKNDLDPYVCLFESCDSAEELHTHSSPWLKHMREHTLKWKCISKSHEPFATQVRSQYVEHMRLAHAGRFSEAQLDILADRNGSRMIGPTFLSCPLCGIRKEDLEQASMENHVVGHLRHLALKSLPAYEESVDDDDDSDQTSVATSRPETRSTIRNYTEDSNLTRQDPSSESNAFEDIYTEKWLPRVIADGTSSVERTSYEGIPPEERRYYEWPFLAEREANSVNPRQDPALATFAMRWYWESRGEETGSKSTHDMTPNCAICHGPDAKVCQCENRALQVAVEQAEERMLRPIYAEIRSWVWAHGQDYSMEVFHSHLTQGARQQAPGQEAGPSAEIRQPDPTTKGGGGLKAQDEPQQTAEVETDLSILRVLVAEGNSTDREVLTSMLQLESIHQVTVAKDDQQAFDLVKKALDNDKPFDIIFMGAEMPNLDGLESAKLIRGVGCKTPIVAVGFFFQEAEIQKCRDAGMEDYLSKPVRRPALRQILNKLTVVPDEKPPDNETVLANRREEVNEAWTTAFQVYPEAFDYYYSLVELTLPADDDRSVVDPPLFALRPRPPYHEADWRSTRRPFSDSDDEVSADGSYHSDSPSGAFTSSRALGKSSGSQDPDLDGESTVDQAESRSGVKQVRFHRDAHLFEIEHDDGDDEADDSAHDAQGDGGVAKTVQFGDNQIKYANEDRELQAALPGELQTYTAGPKNSLAKFLRSRLSPAQPSLAGQGSRRPEFVRYPSPSERVSRHEQGLHLNETMSEDQIQAERNFMQTQGGLLGAAVDAAAREVPMGSLEELQVLPGLFLNDEQPGGTEVQHEIEDGRDPR